MHCKKSKNKKGAKMKNTVNSTKMENRNKNEKKVYESTDEL